MEIGSQEHIAHLCECRSLSDSAGQEAALTHLDWVLTNLEALGIPSANLHLLKERRNNLLSIVESAKRAKTMQANTI